MKMPRYIGPPEFAPHVMGDLNFIVNEAKTKYGLKIQSKLVPPTITIIFLKGTKSVKSGGKTYYMTQNTAGQWGVSFASADQIMLVTDRNGRLNPHWRLCITHECWHLVLHVTGMNWGEEDHWMAARGLGRLY